MIEDEVLATPAGLLEEAKEIVEGILTLPVLSDQLDVVSEQLTAMQNTMAILGFVDILLIIAVVFLLWKHFKK